SEEKLLCVAESRREQRCYAAERSQEPNGPLTGQLPSSSSGARRVDRLFQHLARLERQHAPAGDDDLRARLRVSSLARTFGVHDEVAEPRDFHLLSALQLALDDLEDRLDDLGGLLF